MSVAEVVVLHCRHMDSRDTQDGDQFAAKTMHPSDMGRDPEPTEPTTPPPVAPVSRHLYTLTVDQVAAELYTYRIFRDERTIQRWCKAEKLRAIIDHENGDRYLIDPGSVRDMVAALLAERDDSSQRHHPASRLYPDSVAPNRPTFDSAPTQSHFTPEAQADNRADAATAQPTDATPPTDSRDEVAAMRRRIEELERDNVMLTVDKQVREQMVDYLKTQFGQMIDQALDRSEMVGQLRAENVQLRAMLPSGASSQPTEEWQPPQEPVRFTPQHLVEPEPRASARPAPEPVTVHRRVPWEPGQGV